MKRVLLVDDSPDIRLLVRLCLHGSEFHLDETEDAETALHRIDRQAYDALLVDIELPGMNGMELVRKIRALGGRWAVIPIIALTGHTEPEDVASSLEAGCDRHVGKPVDKKTILRVLRETISAAPVLPPIV